MKKGKSWYGLFFAMAALAIASSLAVCQTATIVPTMVKFSRTVAGAPSRIVGITFAFYKDQQGRAPLWMQTQSVSLDGSGRYNVQLGATVPAGLPKDAGNLSVEGCGKGAGGAAKRLKVRAAFRDIDLLEEQKKDEASSLLIMPYE